MNAKLASTALILAAAQLSALGQVVIFAPDFSGSYTGTGDNQFNYVGSAEDGAFATFGVVDGWFQMVTQHDPESSINQSATRLSRHGSSTPANALAFVDNVGTISLDFRYNPTAGWATGDQSILNVVIGEDFRSGAFNPARGGVNADGPSFANLNLQARTTAGQFRLIAGGGPGSANFNATPSGGIYAISLVMAFNNSGSAQTIDAGFGSYTLNNFSLAVWANGTLVWDNYTNVTNIRDAEFQHVSFGFGVGSNSTYEAAQAFAGTYELNNIVVTTVPEPSVYVLLAGLAGLLVALRRRRS